MTSIHMDTHALNGTGAQSLNQSTPSPTKYDEVERVRQRMDGLRKHHNESTAIYNRTQPIINDQIHDETMKYLKSGQVNGTKTKSQKPRAPKRQRNASTINNNNNINNNISTINSSGSGTNNIPALAQANSVIGTTNGLPPQPQQIQQAPPPPSQAIVQQQGHWPPRIQQQQQQPMHIQQQPHPQTTHFKYQTTNGLYQQQTMQQQPIHQYQAQQAPQVYQQQPTQSQQQQQQFTQYPHAAHNGTHPTHQYINHHHHQQTLPNDLDLTLQAGLECDIDSLIKHEMSVEGQLDFDHNLLLKLDNHYQPHHHH